MKKIICVLSGLIFTIASNVYAAKDYQPGPYLGGQIGWGRLDEGSGYKDASGQHSLGGFTAGRAYGGYSFTPIFSIEAGYSNYPNNTYSVFTNTSISNTNVKLYTIDLVGKLTVPLKKLPGILSYFSLYGKGGAAYSNTKIESNVTKTKDTIMPTYGAGIIYNFNDNIAVDASWTGVLGRNYVENANDIAVGKIPVPTGNMFTIGASYKITDIF